MKKKYDVSVHFSLKAHSIDEISGKFQNWLDSDEYQGQFDFSERTWETVGFTDVYTEPRSMLHHCFPSRSKLEMEGRSTELYDGFLDGFSEDIVCWNDTSNFNDIYFDRSYMLENLKRLNGVAIFIGDIIEGVKEEYDMAKDIGVDIILIP